MSTPTLQFTNKLRGSVALIIGGSSGIGLGAAAALLESGAHVIISSSRQTRIDSAISTLKSSYPEASITGFPCDLASKEIETNLEQLFTQVSSHIKETLKSTHLTHLIYSAGDSLPKIPIEEITLEKFHSALQVRSAGPLLTVKTFLPLLEKSNTTSITITSGAVCEKPFAGGWSIIAFGAAGLTGLTRQLAFDLAPIRVNCVAPGVVDTGLWDDMTQEAKEGMFKHLEGHLLTKRVPDGNDMAECYLYLCRDRNVTGTVIHSNAGAFLAG